MISTLRSTVLGIVLGAAAAAAVAQPRQPIALIVVLIAIVAAPGTAITVHVLRGIRERLARARRRPLRLAAGAAIGAFELGGLLLVFWLLLAFPVMIVNYHLILPALGGATGLALGCMVGIGRPQSVARSTGRSGPPFFDERVPT